MRYKYDMDVDPPAFTSPFKLSKTSETILDRIAEFDDLPFRFWAAKTVLVNVSTLMDQREAQSVICDVIGAALQNGAAIDDHYRLVISNGEMLGVLLGSELLAAEEDDEAAFAAAATEPLAARKKAMRDMAYAWAL